MSKPEKMSWKKIVEGYGLQRIPPEFAKDLCCGYGCCATGNFPTLHLYTTQSLQYDSVQSLDRMLDRVRQDCWCKMHALRHFQPDGVDQ